MNIPFLKYSKVLAILSLTILLIGCTKDENLNNFPSAFTKKVIIEEFSGEWCASCVTGTKKFLEILRNSPNTAIGVSIHSGDPLELQYPAIAPFLISEFDIKYFPFALIDRTIDESLDWDVLVDQRTQIKYNAGLKLETEIIDNSLNIIIKYASTVDFDNVLLSVYLTEDNVPESSPGAQAAGGGNYIHQKVLREVLSSKIGDPIQLKKEIIYQKEYSINISKYKKTDLNIVAFLHFGSSSQYEVINSNNVKAGESSDW
ncbi:MAG TPA: Omp28-related outer membrane protein [Bacteroidetes bacterium]|nr:Omp28-related outer membrane protein [Bacteroidota bacterium]